jgi:hypothetical protein
VAKPATVSVTAFGLALKSLGVALLRDMGRQ